MILWGPYKFYRGYHIENLQKEGSGGLRLRYFGSRGPTEAERREEKDLASGRSAVGARDSRYPLIKEDTIN